MRPVTIQIVSSRDVFLRFVDRLSDLPHEEFWILLLRRSNHVLAEIKISSGGLAGTVADPKIIFGRALALRAAAIVLIHNHPSGNPKPSSSDKSLTNNMREAGKFLDLPVLDHIIVAGKQYVSFADEGLI
jgi:DNA repair protein RadC